MTRKILLSSIAAAVVSMTAQAQTSDKSKTMNTAQSQTTEMTIKGLKVIFKPSAKQTVSAVMFFKGGTSNYGADQQGIESLALSATTECGTKKYNKDAFKDIADQYGVGLNGSSGYDFGTISMSCVKPYFSKGWELFADAVNAPVFEAKELGMLQQKLAANLKQEEGDPDSKLREMALSNTFANTRYAYRPSGTPESVTKFTQQDVSNYYNKTLLNRERMVLVIVGNLTAEEVKSSVEKAFGNIPQATAAPLKGPEALTITGNTLNTEDRKLATNYILGMMGAPESNSASFNAYRLGMDILGDKLFEEVRTKRNLSYAPAAYATGGFHPYSVMYVTTTKPKEAVTVMVDEVKRLRNNGFTATDLRDAKNQFATSYFMKNESNGASAYALGTAEIKGSWKNEESFLEKINAVTLPEMQSVFNKYTDGIKWSYLGDASMADKAAFDKTTK